MMLVMEGQSNGMEDTYNKETNSSSDGTAFEGCMIMGFLFFFREDLHFEGCVVVTVKMCLGRAEWTGIESSCANYLTLERNGFNDLVSSCGRPWRW